MDLERCTDGEVVYSWRAVFAVLKSVLKKIMLVGVGMESRPQYTSVGR
jgi:hypothetical protein